MNDKTADAELSKAFRLDELKRLMSAEKLERYVDFKRFGLEKAIKEINQQTDIEVTYEAVMKKNRCHGIKLDVKVKDVMDRAGIAQDFFGMDDSASDFRSPGNVQGKQDESKLSDFSKPETEPSASPQRKKRKFVNLTTGKEMYLEIGDDGKPIVVPEFYER